VSTSAHGILCVSVLVSIRPADAFGTLQSRVIPALFLLFAAHRLPCPLAGPSVFGMPTVRLPTAHRPLSCSARLIAQRLAIATTSEAQWNQFMPCNTPELLRQFRLETSDRTQWGGGALQIAAAAAIHQVSFRVHSPFGVPTIGTGTQCHLCYSTAPVGHYDVWTEESPPWATTSLYQPRSAD